MKSREVGYVLEEKPKRRGSAKSPARLPITQRRLISTRECSDYLGVGLQRARAIAEEVGAVRWIGSRVLIDRLLIDRWIDNMGKIEQ